MAFPQKNCLIAQIKNIDISEFEIQPDFSWILGNFGFAESQLGTTAPEESRRKIEQCRPESEKRTPAGQKQQDRLDALEGVRQSADGGVAELGSDSLGGRRAFFPQGEKNVGEGDAVS